MEAFTAYKLLFTCEAQTVVCLPNYSGPALRRAFFQALRQVFCENKHLNDCFACPRALACPVWRFVATMERDNFGAAIPRPFALQPVVPGKNRFEPGNNFSFGITLFGQQLSMFSCAIVAVRLMGKTGMGDRATAPGRFTLKEVKVINPLLPAEKSINLGDFVITNLRDMAITQSNVLSYAAGLNSSRTCINLLTPLRLAADGSLVQKLTFRIFAQRLLRRLTELYRYWCEQELTLDISGLLKKADEVQTIQDKTHWINVEGYSSRVNRRMHTGGLTGNITFAGSLKVFLPLLVWGELTHLGKDTTKGNGWYRIMKLQPS